MGLVFTVGPQERFRGEVRRVQKKLYPMYVKCDKVNPKIFDNFNGQFL
jgi:hypothetical protein